MGQLGDMVKAGEIKDRKSLERWLEGRSQTDAIAIARCAACRVLPLYGRAMRDDWAPRHDLTALPVIRLILISGVAGKYPTPEVRRATAAAHAAVATAAAHAAVATAAATAAAQAAAVAATAAAHAAARAAMAAAAAADAAGAYIWEQVRDDARLLEQGGDLLALPLWSIPEPDWFRRADQEMLASWQADDPERWSFWIGWWEGVKSGKQLDWELQRDVALIPDEVWSQGPGAVAAEIAGYELPVAVAATPNAERISINPATGLLRAETLSDLPEDHLADACDMLRDAQSIFSPDGPGQNIAGLVVEERKIIYDALDRYASRPRMLHNACLRVIRRIEAKRAGNFLPEDDHQIHDYEVQIRNVADNLFSFDTEVRVSVTARLELRIKTVSPPHAASILDGAKAVANVAEGYLAKELPIDAAAVADQSLSEEERKDSLFRTASRLLRTYALLASKGVRLVYRGARWTLSEAAGIAGDLKTIAEAIEPVAFAVIIILLLL
ncbi:MAG: hypothetical protein R3E44_07785 [Paracoccaceae bacterium]